MKKLPLIVKLALAAGVVPVVYIAVLLSPLFLQSGIDNMAQTFAEIFASPFALRWCKNTLLILCICLLIYAVSVLYWLSERKKYRRGQEHGSAEMGDCKLLGKKYCNRQQPLQNKILTQHVAISLDGRKTRRNLNTVVIGGAGAGKSLFYVRPNLLQGNTSFVVLDTKGELLRSTGWALKEMGYKIKVLDLIAMEQSDCYNPFVYLREDNDILRLANNIYANTTDKKANKGDQFWDDSGKNLLCALMLYLYHEAPEYEQNFPMVMELLRCGDVSDDSNQKSVLDILFDELRNKSPEHVAVKYYDDYRRGAADTLRSVQVTLASRLTKFNLDSLRRISMTDEMELDKIGEEKTAIFAIIPDNDKSYNFVVGMLYTQLFQRLFYIADKKYYGELPVPVHFLMDEFANVALPDDFEILVSTMRSRGIFVSIILQNLAQLKALFEKQWESIIGNCDSFLYLGNNEQGTHEYISKMLGKQTIDTQTYSRSRGNMANFTTNNQNAGRDLMTADEIRLLNTDKALLVIRGERPVLDSKYHVFSHPNIGLTPYKGGQEYTHIITTLQPTATISLFEGNAATHTVYTVSDIADNPYADSELLTEDELEEIYTRKGA